MIIYVCYKPTHDPRDIILKKYKDMIGYKDDLIIIKNDYDKPYIQNNPFYFNISHSDDYFVMVCSQNEVGIDIEKHHHINEKIVNKYYSTNEKELVRQYKEKAFYDLWCQKESYAKLIGNSIFHTITNYQYDCYFKNIDIDKDYSCVIAYRIDEDIIIESLKI